MPYTLQATNDLICFHHDSNKQRAIVFWLILSTKGEAGKQTQPGQAGDIVVETSQVFCANNVY